MATQIVIRVRKSFRIDVPIQVIFEKPTIATFTKELSKYEIVPGHLRKIAHLRKKIGQMTPRDIRNITK